MICPLPSIQVTLPPLSKLVYFIQYTLLFIPSRLFCLPPLFKIILFYTIYSIISLSPSLSLLNKSNQVVYLNLFKLSH